MAISIEAGPETIHWGFFDGSLKAVAAIDSGDVVTISTVSGGRDEPPPPPFEFPSELKQIHEHDKSPWSVFGHICTGPVAVRGAKRGDVLQVDIEDVQLNYDWGYCAVRPLQGVLPAEESELMYIALDRSAMLGHLPWNMTIPLRPFFGVMAVAPPVEWGTLSTIPPRRNGGNIDNKELAAGSTVYFPVFTDDALFSVGDGHAAQGDGEVCFMAIETGLIGRFRLTVRRDFQIEWPMAETPTHMITMAFDASLDRCVERAVAQMAALACERLRISHNQAYMLCSMAADVRVTQAVNGNKGIHVMLHKDFLGKSVQ